MSIEGEREREERQRIETVKRGWGDRTEEWLCDAALTGDVGSLKEIIAKDEYILDKVLVGSFRGKNPLHIASSKGHLEIVKLLARIDKPELAEVLDTELGTALHIASSKGHLEIVKHLVTVSPRMCMARNREGNNPLHIAAMKGKVEVLKVLLRTRPQAAQVRVDQRYTILHLCVNCNQLQSLEELLHSFKEDPDFIASTDTYGNNILHLAVFVNQYEIVEHLLRNTKIDLKSRNGSGWKALDIYSQVAEREDPNSMDHRIRGILLENGAKRSAKLFFPFDPSWQKKKETLMIVASLFATIAFQAGVNPPGGVWQDSSKPKDPIPHQAGKAITATYYPNVYRYFVYVNTVGFLLSLTTILDLIVALEAKKKAFGFIGAGISWSTTMFMAFTYAFSVIVVTPSEQYNIIIPAILVIVIAWAVLVSFIRKLPYFYREILAVVVGFGLFGWAGAAGGMGMILIFYASTWLARMVRKCAKRNRASEEWTGQSPRDRASELTVQSPRDTNSTPNPNEVRENESRVMIMT